MSRCEKLTSILGFAFAIALVACVFTVVEIVTPANAYADTELTTASTTLLKNNTLRVGFDTEYPPYTYEGDDGSWVGFDIDIAKAVCKANKWKCKLVPIDWDKKDALLEAGTIDCIWSGLTYEGREDVYSWTKPYIDESIVAIGKKGSAIKRVKDLKGKRVCVQKYSLADEAMSDIKKSFGKMTVKKVASYSKARSLLLKGKVDAIICEKGIAAMLAMSSSKIKLLKGSAYKQHCAVAFKNGRTTLANKVTKTLVKLYKSGRVKKTFKKYNDFGLDYSMWCLKK